MGHRHLRAPDSTYTSSATEKSAVIAAAGCTVFDILAYNSSAGDIYLQVFNLAAVPADATAVELPPLAIPAGSTGFLNWPGGRRFSTGCVVVASSTALTKTLVAANSVNIDANYLFGNV